MNCQREFNESKRGLWQKKVDSKEEKKQVEEKKGQKEVFLLQPLHEKFGPWTRNAKSILTTDLLDPWKMMYSKPSLLSRYAWGVSQTITFKTRFFVWFCVPRFSPFPSHFLIFCIFSLSFESPICKLYSRFYLYSFLHILWLHAYKYVGIRMKIVIK